MAKIYFFSSVFLLAGIFSYGQINVQNTYLDAIKLASLYEAYHKENYKKYEIAIDLREIISKYTGYIERYSEGDINVFLTSNYKLSSAFLTGSAGTSKITAPTESFVYSEKELKDIKGLVGLDWQNDIILGTSNFMAGRFKAEVIHYSLEQLFKNIHNEETSLVKSLFPKTFDQINILYNPETPNSYYTTDLLILRRLIHSDIEVMSDKLIETEILTNNLNSPQKDFFTKGYSLVKYTKSGLPLPQIITKLNSESFYSDEVKKAFQMTEMLTAALRDTAGSANYWINPSSQLKFNNGSTKEKLIARYFYGLLYEQLNNSRLYINLPNEPLQFISQMDALLLPLSGFNKAHQLAESKKYTFTNVEKLFEYQNLILNSFKDFFDSSLTLRVFRGQENDEIRKNMEYLIKYHTISEYFLKKDFRTGVLVLLAEVGNDIVPNGEIKNLRTIHFLSELAVVDSEEDMEKLLKAFALPIGSSSIKRNSNLNISLNGYVGLTTGVEIADTSLMGDQTGWNAGLSAPIGISISSSPFTVFLSIIDLGTMVNVRLNNDNSSYTGLRFEHFLSPGVALFYNIPRAPVSFGIHYSYIPNLREFSFNDQGVEVYETNINVKRLNFSILIDIPFFTFYNANKDKLTH